MRHASVCLIVVVCLLGLGCEQKKEEVPFAPEPMTPPKAGEPAAGAPAADAAKAGEPAAGAPAADAAKAGEPAAAPGPEVAECAAILDKCWASIQPALKLLKIADPAALEESYRASADGFLKTCQQLTKEQRDCLTAAEKPIDAIDTCKINEGKEVADKLWAPSVDREIKLFGTKPLDEKAAKAKLKALAGTWVNEWKQAKLKTTWKIKPDGEVQQQYGRIGEKPEEKQLKLSFVESDRLKVQTTETSFQDYTFLLDGKKTFYAGGNLAYGFYPMTKPDAFVVRDSGNYIFFTKGKCQVANEFGQVVAGKCKLDKLKGKKVLKASWQYPGKVWNNGKPAIQEQVYHVIGKYLVDQRLVESGKFAKK